MLKHSNSFEGFYTPSVDMDERVAIDMMTLSVEERDKYVCLFDNLVETYGETHVALISPYALHHRKSIGIFPDIKVLLVLQPDLIDKKILKQFIMQCRRVQSIRLLKN